MADDRLALNTASWLVWTVGHHLARHDDGLQWQREAQALADRAGLADDLALAGLLANTASLHFGAGDYERARPLAERALAIKLDALGPEHPQVADAPALNIAALRALLGRERDEVHRFRGAAALGEERRGYVGSAAEALRNAGHGGNTVVGGHGVGNHRGR